MSNATLNRAGVVKRDDFYTLYEDIAVEVDCYCAAFAGQVVLCNCDDPIESNFVRYFLDNFNRLGLKELIATCQGDSRRALASDGKGSIPELAYIRGGAYGIVVRSVPDDYRETPDLVSLFQRSENEFFKLQGDGDFRSTECLGYMNRADIVVTNPPFSLFREYIALACEAGKRFLVIGNVNALTYKEVFPLFRQGSLWLGHSIRSGDRKFYVPDDYPLDAAGCGIDEKGRRYIRVKGVRWFTNMRSGLGFDQLHLSMSYSSDVYPFYENYNAINVDRTKEIPCDYAGIMGVPVTFLDHYNPDQFDIIMLANGNARANTDPSVLEEVGYRRHPEDKGGVGIIDGRRSYARVLVRNRNPKAKAAL